jgi:hypothetical protein
VHNLARISFDSNGVIEREGNPPASALNDVLNDVSLFDE